MKTYQPHPTEKDFLVRKPEMIEPDEEYYAYYREDHRYVNLEEYHNALKPYEARLLEYSQDKVYAPGVIVPDKVEYVLGKDFELKSNCNKANSGCCGMDEKGNCECMVALPLHPQGEDELWEEFADDFNAKVDRILRDKGASNKEVSDAIYDVFNEQKQSFTIRRK